AGGIGIPPHYFRAAQEAQYVNIMRRQVDHDTDVSHSWRERAEPASVHLEDAAKLAAPEATVQLYDSGVVALDVAHGEQHTGAACGGKYFFALGHSKSDRLLHQQVDPA